MQSTSASDHDIYNITVLKHDYSIFWKEEPLIFSRFVYESFTMVNYLDILQCGCIFDISDLACLNNQQTFSEFDVFGQHGYGIGPLLKPKEYIIL